MPWCATSWPVDLGVAAGAFVSRSAAFVPGEALAGAVVAVMYAGGNVLKERVVARAERDLSSFLDRAPRIAPGLRAGEVFPVDGVVSSANAVMHEPALTGEPIALNRRAGKPMRSGTVNVGELCELRATAAAGKSTYAGIVWMVTVAQTAKAPFIRFYRSERRAG